MSTTAPTPTPRAADIEGLPVETILALDRRGYSVRLEFTDRIDTLDFLAPLLDSPLVEHFRVQVDLMALTLTLDSLSRWNRDSLFRVLSEARSNVRVLS